MNSELPTMTVWDSKSGAWANRPLRYVGLTQAESDAATRALTVNLCDAVLGVLGFKPA